jgi:hypothetical protein
MTSFAALVCDSEGKRRMEAGEAMAPVAAEAFEVIEGEG